MKRGEFKAKFLHNNNTISNCKPLKKIKQLIIQYSLCNYTTYLNTLQASSAAFCMCIGHIFVSHCVLESAHEFPNSGVVAEMSPSRLSLSFFGLLSKNPQRPSILPV